MKIRYFLLAVILFLGYQNAYSQCEVLDSKLKGEYIGGCKKGFANGDGEAHGIDSYKGEFKKGYLHGEGVYTWANEDVYSGSFVKGKMDGYGELVTSEKVTKGYWKFGYYGGESKNVTVYKIINKKYVTKFSVKRIGDGNKVNLKWIKGTRILYSMSGMQMSANNGILINDMTACGYEQIKFPFESRIEFVNEFNTMKLSDDNSLTYNCIFEFEILIPGEYEIIFKD